MDTIIIIFAICAIILFIINKSKNNNVNRALEAGENIYRKIINDQPRSSNNLPSPDVFGCAVASFAANEKIASTFTSRGEPLPKYQFRQLLAEYLPSKYRTDRTYFNCANMEATAFWIAYMENYFTHSLLKVYQPNDEWINTFHEYYWKFSILNMMQTVRQSDLPIFLEKINHASYATPQLDDISLCVLIRAGTKLPEGLTGNDGTVFQRNNTTEENLRKILSSNLYNSFKINAEKYAMNLFSLFIPENQSDDFDIDENDRQLIEAVKQNWATLPKEIKIPEI